MQGFPTPQADRDSGSAQGPAPEEQGLGASLLAGMRNNPLLTGALAAGLAAVTGPQMLKALAARVAQARAIDPYKAERVQSLIERLTPHADEATEAWKMVGGSGPTKLKFLGSGVDATTFQVTPGNSVLKLTRPATHLGFDPHQIAETAPRNVMLPVLEHGKFQDFSGNPELSWFVQPRAHVLESFYDNQRREQALMRIGQTTPSLHSALQELEGLLQKEHPDWRLADTHSGNFGRWAGKDWVIDIGSMEHTPTRNALRHKPPAPEAINSTPSQTAPGSPEWKTVAQGVIPVRDTPITTPPGAPSSPTPNPPFNPAEVATTNLEKWPREWMEGRGLGAAMPATDLHEMLIDLLIRKGVKGGQTPESIRAIANMLKDEMARHGRKVEGLWPR